MKAPKPRILLSGLLLFGLATGIAFSQQGDLSPPADADHAVSALPDVEFHTGPTSGMTIGPEGVIRCDTVEVGEDTRNEGAYIVSWGKPRDGLQAGIRCSVDQQTVRGEAVTTLELVIRNVSNELVSIEYLEAQRYIGELTDTTVTGHAAYDGDGFPDMIDIQPGEIREVGDIPVGHVLEKRPGAAYVYRVELPPGNFQVGCDRLLVDGGGINPPLLGTGYLDIEIVE